MRDTEASADNAFEAWLNGALDDAMPTRTRGALPHGGRYHLHAPGVIELTPPQIAPGARSVILSAGIHGNETAPIELLGELMAALEAGHLRLGAPLLVILGNPASMLAHTRFVTTNLNRLFRRDLADHGDEPQRARTLMAIVDDFFGRHPERRLHLDMHTAIRTSRYPRFAVVPHTDEPVPSAWATLAAADLQAVLLQHQHSWTFSHYSRHYHATEAYTLELGQVRPFGDNDLAALGGMRRWLSALAEGRDAPVATLDTLRFFRVAFELMRRSERFRLDVAEDVANFTEFPVGKRLAHDEIDGDFVVDEAPLAVVFPNARVELGARAALLVRACDPPDR